MNREERMNVMNADDQEDDHWNIMASALSKKHSRLASLAVNEYRRSEYSGKCPMLVESVKQSIVYKLLKMNKPERIYIVVGCIFAIVDGFVQPSFAILYAEVFHIFQMVVEGDKLEAQSQIKLVSGLMVFVGFLKVLASFFEGYAFGKSGEGLTKRIRHLTFASILKQEIGWFDEPENHSGVITTKLSTEASKVKCITGTYLRFVLEAVAMLIMTYVVAFTASWQLTLLFSVFFPIIALSSVYNFRSMTNNFDNNRSTALMSVITEAFNSNRTIATFNLEEYYFHKIEADLSNFRKELKNYALFGIAYGFATSAYPFCNACNYVLGIHLVRENVIEVIDYFRVFTVITTCAQGFGKSISFLSDWKMAIFSAKYLLSLIEKQSQIPTGVGKRPTQQFSGNIVFKDVNFSYANRPNHRILKNFSHTIESGQTVALVGHSGCGKSTILHLLQRFYNPINSGTGTGIFFDDMNILELAPSWVRSQIGIVSQEPHLFNLTIRENIEYGDNARQVTMNEIIIAARMANIHDFIMSLPEAYETICGEGGSQLSGGQKQRVAIARAMIHNPTLLLLDEATSALDTESEHVVQTALEALMRSRTSLVVAHRLSTVLSCDEIVVIKDGEKVESGSPNALLKKRGAFHLLHHHQNKDN